MLPKNILKEATCLIKNSHKLPNISQRSLQGKRRIILRIILRSMMPNEHPASPN